MNNLRAAYCGFDLAKERARAAALGYEDPVNPSYEATTAMYEKTLLECLKRIKDLKSKTDERRIAAMVASHNEDTVRFAIQKYYISLAKRYLIYREIFVV